MCSAVITKNKPQKGRGLLHPLPTTSEDLGQLGLDIPGREHAASLLHPGQDLIPDLADLLAGDGIGDRLQMKLSLLIYLGIEVKADPLSQIVLQRPLGDVAVLELPGEAQHEDQTVLQGIRQLVLLDIGETVGPLKCGPVKLSVFIGEMTSTILVLPFERYIEFYLDSLGVQNGAYPHTAGQLAFLTGIKNPPECGLLVAAVGPVAGVVVGLFVVRRLEDRIVVENHRILDIHFRVVLLCHD